MTVPPELRITDREVDDLVPCRTSVVCPSCHGLGVHEGRSVVDDVPCWSCWGRGETAGGLVLPPGASARIGAVLVARLPHLRHATWPPKRERINRRGLAMVLGMAAMGAVR